MRLAVLEAIGAAEGMEVKDVILKKGENYFRKKERAMVRKLTGGYIIALGGGTVINEKNVEYLKSIGKIVFIYNRLTLMHDRLVSVKNKSS